MSTADKANPAINAVLWVATIALLAAGIYGNIYFAGESLLYRVLGLLAIALVAGFVAIQTTQGRSLWELIKSARTEIRKVVWPTRQETMQTSLLVLALVVVAGLILWGMDTLFGWIASLFLG